MLMKLNTWQNLMIFYVQFRIILDFQKMKFFWLGLKWLWFLLIFFYLLFELSIIYELECVDLVLSTIALAIVFLPF